MRSALIHRLVASGFIAAAVAAVLCSSVSPQHPVAGISLLMRAVAYVAAVFGAGAAASYLASSVSGNHRPIGSSDVTLRIAATALWLPPLLLFYGQNSWFVLVLFIVFVIELSRLTAYLRRMICEPGPLPAETAQEVLPFSVLKRDSPYGISMLAAFALQAAIFAAIAGHIFFAAALYLLGTAAIAYRTFQLFRDFGDADDTNPDRRRWLTAASVTLLIVFAWLPYLAISNSGEGAGSASGGSAYLEARGVGSSVPNRHDRAQRPPSVSGWLQSFLHPERSQSHGDSFAVAKQLLESSLPKSAEGTDARRNRRSNTNIRITEPVTGPIFPGVELYPDEHHVTKLVAPPVTPSREPGNSNSDPFSIPFDGVYWFWHGPSEQPPLNSVVLHGSPSAHFFRSTDGDLMSMEARQNLGFAVDPRRYSAIEVEIQNADPFPGSVSLVLKIRNTAIAGMPSQNLGLEKVPVPASASEDGASHQRLRFHIPSRLAMGSFDELTVSYFLKGGRSNRSARIAIERFRFVPRGW